MSLLRAMFAVMTFGLLAACGADGDPVEPGVSLSGEAQIGVSGKL